MNIKKIITLPLIIISIIALLETVYTYNTEQQKFPTPLNYAHISAKNQNNHEINAFNQKKVVILDLSHFITEDVKQIMRKIGVGKMMGYTLTHWRNPVDSCLDALEKMSSEDEHKSPVLLTYKERRMPHCIVSWQQGECLHHEVKNKLVAYIEKIDQQGFFSSKKEKEITQCILEIALDPNQLSTICKPIPVMIKIAQELKDNGYALYAIANLTQEAHAHMQSAYPEIITLFDGIVTSYQIHTLKDNKKTFEHLLTTYQLNPTSCLFVDKEEKTLQAALDAGITNIAFTHQKNLRATLKKNGILG